ncbi:MAG TPA: SGNH/GDSL hydrolase family protein [Actinomycetota bacterium]|jgi:hypothetical protein|nr:SGNH/GDSL hydrolase family protein [Actinomycetota bacterium]
MVVIGDSFATLPSWPELYAAEVARVFGVEVRIHDFARSGDPDIFGMVRSDPAVREALSGAEVIAIQPDVGPPTDRAEARWFDGTCGGRDGMRCFREEARAFQTEWRATVEELVALRGPDEAIIRAFQVGTWVYDTLYGPDFRGSEDWEAVLAGMILVNEAIADVANAAGIAVIDVNAAFSGADYRQPLPPELSNDGLHPSQQGSEVIVELLVASGWEPFESSRP